MATRQAVNNTRATTPVSVPEITRIQVEGNDTVSFLYGTTPPYQWVRGMSQIMTQNPAYISYRYDTITISQVAGESFTFTVYSITDVGGNTFPALTSLDTSDVVAAKTQEVYRLLVTSVFKGCCECGNTEPECSIQYTAGTDPTIAGTLWDVGGVGMRINYFTANSQDFTGFWPIIQDGSWIFVFSKTDPTVYGVYQLSGYTDGGTFAQFNSTLLAGPAGFPDGTSLCVDVTSVGGSLVQDWQDTLNISSLLTQDNLIDGGGFTFEWENVNRYILTSSGYQSYISTDGSSVGQVYIQNGGVTITGTDFIDVITPGWATATPGMVLALDSSGHVEYTLAGTGTISSIGLNMPPAFTVSTPNPLTSNGDFTVTGAGTDLEYINGLGELATLPVYTVENGLHAFGGVPGEAPPNPFLFHLGGPLLEDTLITATEVLPGPTYNEWVLGVSGLVGQDTRQPFAVSNLGDGGVSVFADYGADTRPNPTVEMITGNDLSQPILNLHMQGNLPDANNTMLRLRYSGRPDLATTTIDYQFRNNNAVAANSNFIGSRLSTEVVNFVDNNEQTRFNLQLMEGGDLANKLQVQGYGQLVLNEYGLNVFSNGVSNIDNTLEYVLAVDASGNVYKKLSEGGGTVTEIDATGLLTTSPDPITTTGTVTSEMNSGFLVGRYDDGLGVFQEITVGTGLTLSATGELTADGGGGTYDGDQGVYKDTSLTNDTFMLGAPSGLQGTIPFFENRFVDVDAFRLQMEGVGGAILLTKDGGAAIPLKPAVITSVTDSNIPAGTFISENFDAVDIYTYGVDTVALIVENAGTGADSYAADFSCINGHGIFVDSSTFNTFQINTASASNSTIDNVIFIGKRPLSAGVQGEGTSIAMSPGNDWNNVDIPIGATLNCVVSDPGASGRDPIPATVDFRVDTNRLGVIIEHTSFIGNGQLRLHEYGQTPAQFYDAAPVWALGVDVNGNVVEIAAGGGPGTTYTVDNGLSPQTLPTPNPDNFQLGGPLVQDTTITGGAVPFTNYLHIDNLSGFSLDVNDKGYLISENGPDKSQFIFTKLYAASKYDNNLTGESAEVLVGGDSGISDVKAYLRASTVFGETGIYAGVVPGVLPYTANMLGIKTPNVANGSAQVGQVLTLKSMTGSEAGRVEFEDATGGGGIKSGDATQVLPGEYETTITGVTSLAAGDTFIIKFDSVNENGSTLKINTLPAYDIFKNTDVKIASGDIKAGQEITIVFDGTAFQAIGLVTNQLLAYVHNAEGAVITKGQAVYAFGASGDKMSVKLAMADSDATSAKTIGMVYDSSIGIGGEGYIIIQGVIEGINTAAYTAGDTLYLSGSVPGGYVSTPTYAPVHRVYVGIVEKANAGNGQIYVRCQNGYELDELHDVQAQSPNDKDTLWYDSSVTPTPQWKTGSVPSLSGTFSLGVTVDGSGGVITAGVKGYVRVPYACTINSWSILTNNAGTGATVTFDIWRANNAIPTVGGSLVGAGTKPFLTSNTAQITSANPTGWTSVALAANDVLGFNVESGAAVFSWANLQLLVTKI